jgi:hypothetical protein
VVLESMLFVEQYLIRSQNQIAAYCKGSWYIIFIVISIIFANFFKVCPFIFSKKKKKN